MSKPGIFVFTQSEVSTETEDISTSDMHCAKYRAGQLPAHEVAQSHSVSQNLPHNNPVDSGLFLEQAKCRVNRLPYPTAVTPLSDTSDSRK